MHASPSLGENFDPFGQHLEEPSSFYAQLRHEEPITFSPVLNAYLVSRFEDVRAILSQPDVFSSRETLSPVGTLYPQTLVELSKGYPFASTLINSDGAAHRRLREPLRKAFSPPRIRALEPFIRERIQQLLDQFLHTGHAEIISQFASLLPLDVIFTLLGFPSEDREQVKRWCDDWTAILMSPLPEEQQVACARNVLILHRYLLDRIEERRLVPREDLLTDLVTTQLPGEEPFSEAQLIYTIGSLIIAGHITTTHLIGTGLVLLLQEPGRWRTLCEHAEISRPPFTEPDHPAPSTSPLRTTSAFRGIVGIPPPSDSRTIQQREQTVMDIYNKLTQPGISALVLAGIGGIGKSTLAALLYRYVEAKHPAGNSPFAAPSLWLRVDPAVTLADILSNLCAALDVPTPDLGTLTPPNQAVVLTNVLNTAGKGRLVVLDQFENVLDNEGNALPDRPGIGEWLDALNSQPFACRVLLTSRPDPQGTHKYPQTNLQIYHVEGLNEAEGRELLHKWSVNFDIMLLILW